MTKSGDALTRYSVTPIPPVLPARQAPTNVERQSTDFWEYAPTLGCLFAVPIALVVGAELQSFGGCIGGILLGVAVAFIVMWLIGRSIESGKTERLQAQADSHQVELWEQSKLYAREASEREAAATSANLRALLIASAELHQSLFESLEDAQAALNIAVSEHEARVIPTFWDAVEAAAGAFGRYDRALRQLVSNATQYYETLRARTHTFPPFPYLANDLPSEEDVVKRFRSVVRRGQSDYQFANIWEQRRTREAIVTGFGSLERAVRAIGADVILSLTDIQLALDAGFDRIVDSQYSLKVVAKVTLEGIAQSANIQRREVLSILRSQNSKLDNIQWRRKPLGSRYIRE